MYKLLSKIFINFLVTFGVIYLLVGFVVNDYNATKWTQDQRSVLIMIWVIIQCLTIPAVVYDHNEN
jgi:hypothetical protein